MIHTTIQYGTIVSSSIVFNPIRPISARLLIQLEQQRLLFVLFWILIQLNCSLKQRWAKACYQFGGFWNFKIRGWRAAAISANEISFVLHLFPLVSLLFRRAANFFCLFHCLSIAPKRGKAAAAAANSNLTCACSLSFERQILPSVSTGFYPKNVRNIRHPLCLLVPHQTCLDAAALARVSIFSLSSTANADTAVSL